MITAHVCIGFATVGVIGDMSPTTSKWAKKSPTTLKVGHPQCSRIGHPLTPTTNANVDLHPPPLAASCFCADKKTKSKHKTNFDS